MTEHQQAQTPYEAMYDKFNLVEEYQAVSHMVKDNCSGAFQDRPDLSEVERNCIHAQVLQEICFEKNIPMPAARVPEQVLQFIGQDWELALGHNTITQCALTFGLELSTDEVVKLARYAEDSARYELNRASALHPMNELAAHRYADALPELQEAKLHTMVATLSIVNKPYEHMLNCAPAVAPINGVDLREIREKIGLSPDWIAHERTYGKDVLDGVQRIPLKEGLSFYDIDEKTREHALEDIDIVVSEKVKTINEQALREELDLGEKSISSIKKQIKASLETGVLRSLDKAVSLHGKEFSVALNKSLKEAVEKDLDLSMVPKQPKALTVAAKALKQDVALSLLDEQRPLLRTEMTVTLPTTPTALVEKKQELGLHLQVVEHHLNQTPQARSISFPLDTPKKQIKQTLDDKLPKFKLNHEQRQALKRGVQEKLSHGRGAELVRDIGAPAVSALVQDSLGKRAKPELTVNPWLTPQKENNLEIEDGEKAIKRTKKEEALQQNPVKGLAFKSPSQQLTKSPGHEPVQQRQEHPDLDKHTKRILQNTVEAIHHGFQQQKEGARALAQDPGVGIRSGRTRNVLKARQQKGKGLQREP